MKTKNIRSECFRAVKALKGAAAAEVTNFLAAQNIHYQYDSIRSTLSNMVQRNLLKLDEHKSDCQSCGRPRVRYQVTDDGKIWYHGRYSNQL